MRFPFRSSRGWWLGAAAATLCSVLLLQGCDNERITTTEEGFTTENEVYAKWGQPENVWDGPDGERILEYNRQPQGVVNYMISVGPDGKVSALRQVLTRVNFDKVQPGMMMEDVRRMLGTPAKQTTYPIKGETVYIWRFREGNALSNQFVVTFDRDLRVLSTAITDDPMDPHSPDKS